jgi:sarcosine oxidase subunit beta
VPRQFDVGPSRELNYNVMYSPRGVLMLGHNVHDVQMFKRHVHANRLAGVDNEWLTPARAKEFCPPLSIGPELRYPILGAALQGRGGTARPVRGDTHAPPPPSASTSCRIARSPALRVNATGAVTGMETTRGAVVNYRLDAMLHVRVAAAVPVSV